MDECRRAIQNLIYSTKALGRSSLLKERQSRDQEQKKVEQKQREDGSDHNGTPNNPARIETLEPDNSYYQDLKDEKSI